MSRPFLTRAEIRSDLWQRLRAGAAERVEQLRTSLESTHCTEQQTAVVRGELLGLRWLLWLETAPQDLARKGDMTSIADLAATEGGDPD